MGELGYIEELLGCWDVQYPGADGMIVDGYVERLELKIDGTYVWQPTPLWARPEGRWGISFDEGAEQQMKLYIEERRGGTYRSNWIVLGILPTQELWSWQRTRTGVIFADRVFMASRNTSPAPTPALATTDCPHPAQDVTPRRALAVDFPISLIESLNGMLGPAAWGAEAATWRTPLGTLAASLIEVDMPLPARRVTGLLTLSLTVSVGSHSNATDLMARLNAMPGLGAAFASPTAKTNVVLASQLPLSPDDTPQDRERLGFLLATAAVAHLQLAAACRGVPAPASLQHRDATWWTARELVGSELACSGEDVRLAAGALYLRAKTGVRFLGPCAHPCLGNGLLDEVSIAVDADVVRATQLAGALNALHRIAPLPLLGAWTADEDGGRITHSSFFPNIAHETGLLTQLAAWQRERLNFAHHMLKRLAKRPL